MARKKLQPPWIRYYEELSLFFDPDPDVTVVFDEEDYLIKMYVDSPNKAAALQKLVPDKKQFGNVSLSIEIVPGNEADDFVAEGITDAFVGNPIVEEVTHLEVLDFTYVVFRKEVVQYYNDDLGDAYGNCSTLWQEIAKRLFEPVNGLFYCTSEEETPLLGIEFNVLAADEDENADF